MFAVLQIQSHLTGAGIRKCEGFPPAHLLFVLTNLVFLHIKTVHDLLHRPLKSLFQKMMFPNDTTQNPSYFVYDPLNPNQTKLDITSGFELGGNNVLELDVKKLVAVWREIFRAKETMVTARDRGYGRDPELLRPQQRPLPPSVLLLGSGLLGLVELRRFRKG